MRLLSLIVLCLLSITMKANDGVVFVQGNQLVPLK